MYFFMNVWLIEEIFDVWYELFKCLESCISLFSSVGGLFYLFILQIREEDEFVEICLSFSCYSVQESDVFVLNNVRFVLCLSFVSDNIDKILSFEFRFVVSLGSRDVLVLEIGSQIGLFQEVLNIGDQDYERCKDFFGVDEMMCSLFLILSFIVEYG